MRLSAIEEFEWGKGISQLIPIQNVEFTLITVGLYVASVKILQRLLPPPKRFSEKDTPQYIRVLSKIAAFYNFFMSFLSLIMSYGMGKGFLKYWKMGGGSKRGFAWALCKGGFWEDSYDSFFLYLYMITKPLEFADTYFRLFMRKPVTFLHFWHHATVPLHMIIMYTGRIEWANFGSLINAMVHVIMYFYYGLVSLRIRFPWKNLITMVQLAQFTLAFVIVGVFWSEKEHCPIDDHMLWGFSSLFTFYLSYFVLFIRFYYLNYIKKKKKTT